MELRHLRYFVAVAEELHFGRAAKRLHLAQPSLSQQIRQLEEHLGVELLLRSNKRRVRLTEAGAVLLGEARSTLARVERAAESARRAGRGEVGRLAVGFVPSATDDVLPDILRTFRERFPVVGLVLHELTTPEQAEALRDERIQVGFCRPPVGDGSLACEIVLREPLVAALPEGHRLCAGSEVPLRSLAGEPFVLFPRESAPAFHDRIVGVCRRAGFEPEVAQEAIQMHTIASMVAVGMGVALVPASLQNLRRKGVVYKPLRGGAPAAEIAAIWRPEDPSPVLQRFLGVVGEVVGSPLA